MFAGGNLPDNHPCPRALLWGLTGSTHGPPLTDLRGGIKDYRVLAGAGENHDANDYDESVHGHEETDEDQDHNGLCCDRHKCHAHGLSSAHGVVLSEDQREHRTMCYSCENPFCTAKDPEANIVMLATGHSLCLFVCVCVCVRARVRVRVRVSVLRSVVGLSFR